MSSRNRSTSTSRCSGGRRSRAAWICSASSAAKLGSAATPLLAISGSLVGVGGGHARGARCVDHAGNAAGRRAAPFAKDLQPHLLQASSAIVGPTGFARSSASAVEPLDNSANAASSPACSRNTSVVRRSIRGFAQPGVLPPVRRSFKGCRHGKVQSSAKFMRPVSSGIIGSPAARLGVSLVMRY